MRVFSFCFIFFLSLIMVLNGKPFVRKNRVWGLAANINNGQESSLNNNNNIGLSRVARRKRDFQHGFNKA